MRSLARGGYTEGQVLQQLVADNAVVGPRFDLVDRQYRLIDRLDVKAATVDWDATRTIPRSLKMQMVPRSDLLNVPFRLLVKPYWMLKMDNVDGGWAEWPFGAFVFTIPERDIQEDAAAGSGSSDLAGDGTSPENPELWSLTLGDQMHYFKAGGVDITGFQVAQGSLVTDAIIRVLAALNMPDNSGIARSEATAATGLSFTLSAGSQAVGWEQVYVPGRLAYGMGGYYQWRQVVKPLQDQATSWADIVGQLHTQLGYNPPGFDLDNDRYTARPAVNYGALTGAPVISYEPGDTSLLMPGIHSAPNLTALGNRAVVTQANPTGFNDVAIVDLNTLIPGHPLSQGVIGFYMNLPGTSPGGASNPQLVAQATALLNEAVRSYESLTFSTMMNPQHDAWEIGSMRIPNDPIFAVPQLTAETYWSADLFAGTMSHTWRRLGISATAQ